MFSILVTGANGFIGSHLITRLKQTEHKVVVASRKILNTDNESKINWIKINQIDGDTNWEVALKKIDIVIHLAARAHILHNDHPNPLSEFLKVNTEGTANLVKQSIQAGVKHFIFISSIGAITSLSNQTLTEKSPCKPDTPYGLSKLKAEEALIKLTSQSDMTYTILRPNLVYGKGNPGNMKRLLKLIQKGFPLPFGLVRNYRSFIYVGNLVDAIVTCIRNSQAKNQTFLVSDNEDISTSELIRKIAFYLNLDCKLLPVSPILLKFSGYLGDGIEFIFKRSFPLNSSTMEKILGSLIVDTSKIRTTLNWQPPYSLEEGLQQTFIDELK